MTRSFASDRRGGVAMLVALTLVPLLGLVGLAVDFGFATQTRAALDMAADTAALSAVKTATNAASAGNKNAIALGEAAGLQWFKAQTQLLINSTTAPPKVVVSRTGTAFTATVTYQGAVSLFFGPLFGVRTASVGDIATAIMTSNTYVDVTFLLDNSSSMLVASTEDGIVRLSGYTQAFKGFVPNGLQGKPCAFACHWQSDPSKQDYFSIARAKGVQLRGDVLRLAVNNAIQSMLNDAVVPNQFRIGLFTFAEALTQIYPANSTATTTTDIAHAKEAVQTIPVPCCKDVPDSYFPTIMADFVRAQTASGDGTSPATPKKVVMIITDGMSDYPPRKVPTNMGPIDPANCNAIKALGYTVYVLYTTYSNDSAALLGVESLRPYVTGAPSSVRQALDQCASTPANVTEAADPASIITALNTMLLSAIGTAGRFAQ